MSSTREGAAGGPSKGQRHDAAWLEHALAHEFDVGSHLSYTAFLQRTARRLPDKTALVCGERSLTYAQVFEAVAARAGHLAGGCAVRPGERVALLMDNSELYEIWYLAILAMGAVAVPLNYRLAAPEIAYQLHNAGVVHVVTQARYLPVLVDSNLPSTDADAAMSASQPVWNIEAAQVRADAPAAIYFTSGTTGRPKGVVHTHRSLIAGAVQAPRAWEYDESDVVALAMTPMFHIANHTWFLPHLYRGGTMVIDTYATDTVLDLIARQRITHLFAVPTMLLLMIQRHRSHGGDYSHVRTVAFGAAPMPPERLADLQRVFPRAALVHGMGQTESCGTLVSLPSALAFEKAGSVGTAIDGVDIRVVDPQGGDLQPMAVGELLARGPSVMSHYHDQPEATAETLADGWLHTGDIGYLDEDGCLFLVDRKKDLIIRGGENIYSSEVENVLYMHPGVAQAAVVAGRSELFGEEVLAFVVRRESDGMELDSSSLQAHCAQHLADYKVPKEILIVAELPQTATGKIQKHVLRTQLPAQYR